jgi:hypothetical protein
MWFLFLFLPELTRSKPEECSEQRGIEDVALDEWQFDGAGLRS